MEVTIERFTGEHFTVHVELDDTVRELRRRVEEHLGLDEHVRGELLGDDKVLQDDDDVTHGRVTFVTCKRHRIAVAALKSGKGPRTGVIRIVDMHDGSTLREWLPGAPVESMTALADGCLASRAPSDQNTVAVWDPKAGEIMRTFPTGHTDGFAVIAACHAGMATGSEDCLVNYFGVGDKCLPLVGHESMVFSLASFDGSHLASGDSGQEIRIWDLSTGVCVEKITEAHDSAGWVHGLCALDAHLLVSCSDTDTNVKVWDRRTGPSCIRACGGHGGGPGQGAWDVCAVQGGFATGSTDALVRIWELRGSEPSVLKGHSNEGNGVRKVASIESKLVSMEDGVAICIWDLQSGGAPLQATTHAGTHARCSSFAII